MTEFTQGLYVAGRISILADGVEMTPEQIVAGLNALDFLVHLKEIKNDADFSDFYKCSKKEAWDKAKEALTCKPDNEN